MLELALPVCSKMNSFEAPKKFFAELPDDQSGQVTAGLLLGVLHKTSTYCAMNVSYGFGAGWKFWQASAYRGP